MCAVPSPKYSAVAKEAMKFKAFVDGILMRMQREHRYTPTRHELEECAEKLIDFMHQHHKKIAPYESYLRAAVIDLTEVPEMSPQMQRISFQTAVKDAAKNLDLFLSACD